MNYIQSLLSRPWFSYRQGAKPNKNAFEAGDVLKSSVRLYLLHAVQVAVV